MHPNRGQHKKQTRAVGLTNIEIQPANKKWKEYLAETNCPKRPFRDHKQKIPLLNFPFPPGTRWVGQNRRNQSKVIETNA